MRHWSWSSSDRLTKKSLSLPLLVETVDNRIENPGNRDENPVDQEERRSQHGDPNHPMILQDYINPTRTGSPFCITFPTDATRFNSKPAVNQFLPTFHCLESKNPYHHLKEFWRSL